jgi:hypothetical protein
MSRLKHTTRGYIRSLQISKSQVFAFVEGLQVDRFFYGEVCRRTLDPRGLSYQVRLARELPSASGGKQALLAFYRSARSSKRLISNFGGKQTVLVFFLDKDVDDVMRRKCRSRHVVYTGYYDVQNHVCRHSDFVRAVSSAASIDRQTLIADPRFTADWFSVAARRWRHWMALCLLAVRYGVPEPNYRACSKVNVPLNGAVDPVKYKAAVQAAAAHLGVSTGDVEQRLSRLLKKVDRHLSKGTHDQIFKGKWYGPLLEADLRAAFPNAQHKGLADRVTAALATTLDFSEPWADAFSRPLIDLVRGL